MNAAKIISAKRDGQRLDEPSITELIRAYVAGDVPDYQMSAFAMAVYFQGMDLDETATLTRAMRDTGLTMSWPDLANPVVDKHSTGGVGDKISLVLAPMLVACGLAVPMISGRGLGITGGTLDKLESIPGFRTDLTMNELQNVVQSVGCVITGASEQIAPADRKLYALRDVTGTVPSIPLITASILSKKLAEGLDSLVFDVKWGNGSFMKSMEQAESLAESLVSVAEPLGVKATALITDMNQPLGMVGNAVEVDQSVDILKNEDVHLETVTLATALGAELLLATEKVDSMDDAVTQLTDTIRSGAAFEVFEKMVAAQGGDLNQPRPRAKKHVLTAGRDGIVTAVDTEQIGWSVIEMGGGRQKVGDPIDHSTGLEWLSSIGQTVKTGDPLLNVFCPDNSFDRLKESLQKAITITDQPIDPPELIVKRIDNGAN